MDYGPPPWMHFLFLESGAPFMVLFVPTTALPATIIGTVCVLVQKACLPAGMTGVQRKWRVLSDFMAPTYLNVLLEADLTLAR